MLQLFAPIQKVDETSDGGRQVLGFAVLEEVDKQSEIADFDSTVAAFEKWSQELEVASRGKSKGNVREMHQPKAVGKVIDWHPGEKKKLDGTAVRGVYVSVRVPPQQTSTIEKIDEGILTGFSIGGKYEKRWWDSSCKAHRYSPVLAELSLVDNPAGPNATFDMVKSVDGGGLALEESMQKAVDSEREQLKAEAEDRAKKYDIAFQEGAGHLTPPSGKPSDPNDYADPVNFRYPIDSTHVQAAIPYFNRSNQREAGGYSTAEWNILGERIVSAANKLIRSGYSLDGETITTPSQHDAAAKALADTALAKIAGTADLEHAELLALFQNKLFPSSTTVFAKEVRNGKVYVEDWENEEETAYPYSVAGGKLTIGEPEPVSSRVFESGEEMQSVGEVVQKIDPEDKDVDSKIAALESALADVKSLQAASEKGDPASEDADNKKINDAIASAEAALAEVKGAQKKDETADKAADAVGLLKVALENDDALEKAGVSISADRRKHLHHAIDHIHHALGNDDQVSDKTHVGSTPDATATAPAADDDMSMAAKAEFTKAVDGLKGELAIATTGIAKAEEVSKVVEALSKVAEQLTQLQSEVKAIGEAPQPGGAYAGVVPKFQEGEAIEKDVLQRIIQRTDDPVLKDALGRHVAADVLGKQLSLQGPRPTGPARL